MGNFKIGDEVSWFSSSAGTTKEKKGEIIAVIAAHQQPKEVIKPLEETGLYTSTYGGGWARIEESYIVKVDHPGTNKKPTIYWPLVKNLTKL